ncbi:CLUMA_CG020250, isoform A [Clunio marinus]|uniref:CLUMA_CG020250, isoform A n=1 Tax=Clunio marinus TaxID=568069 RepID=A0A1J1J4F2_9DIPT|nr:CLUMA_CG020250, isoform A [Clunio marinus]
MSKITNIILICVVAFAFFMQISLAAPVTDSREGNDFVDEIIHRLNQLKQQNEGNLNNRPAYYSNSYPQGINRVHRTLDNLGGGYLLKRAVDSLGGGHLLKRTPSDSSRSMDSLGGAYKHHGRSQRFAPARHSLDRSSLSSLYNYYSHPMGSHPKRNFDEIDRFGDFDKRNFDEIDRSGWNDFGKRQTNFDEIDRNGFNEFKKRNFDEIDRLGSFTDF